MVLSACSTACGGVGWGEGVVGLFEYTCLEEAEIERPAFEEAAAVAFAAVGGDKAIEN